MIHSQGLLVFVGLMESMKAVDSLNPEQFADLASSLNNFFTKINNEQQQQQVPYSSVESNPSSSTTTSECNYIFSCSFCKKNPQSMTCVILDECLVVHLCVILD